MHLTISTEGYQQGCCPERTSSYGRKQQVNVPKAAAATEPVLPSGRSGAEWPAARTKVTVQSIWRPKALIVRVEKGALY